MVECRLSQSAILPSGNRAGYLGWGGRLVIFFLAILLTTYSANAAIESLTPVDRESLRSKVQSWVAEIEGEAKREPNYLAELAKLNKEVARYQVYDRFPLKEDIPQLKRNLTEVADRDGIEIRSVQPKARAPEPAPLPKLLHVDQLPFSPSTEQIIQWVDVTIEVQGVLSRIQRWIRGWPGLQLRWIEVRGAPIAMGQGIYRIKARTYCFRSLELPRLALRESTDIQPDPSLSPLASMTEQEPWLSPLLNRIDDNLIEAQSALDIRKRIMVERARLDFYLSKVLPSGERK